MAQVAWPCHRLIPELYAQDAPATPMSKWAASGWDWHSKVCCRRDWRWHLNPPDYIGVIQRCQNVDLILGLNACQDGISDMWRACMSVAIACAAGQFMMRTFQVTDGSGALKGPEGSSSNSGHARSQLGPNLHFWGAAV